ncbi:MAG: hypothetical protein DRQ24_00740 [Candidatus Latescibacterota bacterium]|nr:MAG: hypothetical protein DRQ24_00740 [Candidatus Latescibacterota bacterium]
MVKAAAAKADITPPVGVPLDGNVRDKNSRGIHDSLFAKTLVLADGEETVAVVACDLVGLSSDLVEQARQLIEKSTGIKGENVLISATHTHSGPAVLGLLGPKVDESYLEILAQKIAGAVYMAQNNLQKVSIGVGRGTVEGISFNRRIRMKDGSIRMNWEGLPEAEIEGPAGPIDPEVGVVRIDDKEGNPIAFLINFACHAAVLTGDNLLISADYPGYTTRMVEQICPVRWGLSDGGYPGTVALFTNGAEGNINHIDVHNPLQTLRIRGFKEAERIGRILGGEVVKVIERIKPEELAKVRSVSQKIELPLREISEAELQRAREVVEASPGKKLFLVDGVPEEIYARELLKLSQYKGKSALTEVQVITLGDKAALVGIPGEMFVELGLEIKRNSKFPYTFVLGLANDYVGYIPTSAAFDEGGYEVKTASWSKFDRRAGEILVESVLDMLGEDL